MWFQQALVFLHLIAMAVAVGRMLEYDFRFLCSVHRRRTKSDLAELLSAKKSMTFALWLLWTTGILLVYLGAIQNPSYLANEKLWMKLLSVVVLTVNGVLMHRLAFPLLQQPSAFLSLPLRTILVLGVFATVSSVSWLYASFLGVARWWNHTVSFTYAFFIYLALMGMAIVGMTLVMILLRRQHRKSDLATGWVECRSFRGVKSDATSRKPG